MDRRLRSPARRPAAPRAGERQRGGVSPHRFLRPGALARLRDSKIIARSLRSAAAVAAALPQASSPPPRSPTPASHAAADGVPCFLGTAAARGMRYPLRKKLAAARSVVFLPPPQHEAVEMYLDAFAAAPADLVAAR